MAKPPPTEFGPETTGFIGDGAGWIGWDLGADRVFAAWQNGWPDGTVALPVHLGGALPGGPSDAFDETDFGAPSPPLGQPLTIQPTSPIYRLVVPGSDVNVALRAAPNKLEWWSWSGQTNAVPSDIPIQAGQVVELIREHQPIVIPAQSVVRSATDIGLV